MCYDWQLLSENKKSILANNLKGLLDVLEVWDMSITRQRQWPKYCDDVWSPRWQTVHGSWQLLCGRRYIQRRTQATLFSQRVEILISAIASLSDSYPLLTTEPKWATWTLEGNFNTNLLDVPWLPHICWAGKDISTMRHLYMLCVKYRRKTGSPVPSFKRKQLGAHDVKKNKS